MRKIVEFVNSAIEEQQVKIAEREGFKITDHSLTIYGECTDHLVALGPKTN